MPQDRTQEQEPRNMKVVDSIQVEKARRENQARKQKHAEDVEKEVGLFSSKANDLHQQKREQKERANRAIKRMRDEWLDKVRRTDIKAEHLRALMQEHLAAEDKLMRSFLRMWTTADFSPIAVLGQGSFGVVHLVRQVLLQTQELLGHQ